VTKAYFFSDAHLGLSTKEEEHIKEQRILKFLDVIQKDAQHIFIVGDLFDAWFEYKTVIPKGFHRLLTKLEDLVRSNIVVHYLAGNHDYWMGTFFREDLGMKTYYEPFEITLNNKKIYIHHGDGLATNDAGYRFLKKILRNPLNIRLYSLLHPDIGITLAKKTSKKSRHYTSTKDYGEEDGMIKFASAKIQEGYDIVLMGHRHQPVCKEIGKGIYINLGDWMSHFTYAEFTDDTIELKRWNE
jgi:UDP-2,3-diacylglucosamine hydrolase